MHSWGQAYFSPFLSCKQKSCLSVFLTSFRRDQAADSWVWVPQMCRGTEEFGSDVCAEKCPPSSPGACLTTALGMGDLLSYSEVPAGHPEARFQPLSLLSRICDNAPSLELTEALGAASSGLMGEGRSSCPRSVWEGPGGPLVAGMWSPGEGVGEPWSMWGPAGLRHAWMGGHSLGEFPGLGLCPQFVGPLSLEPGCLGLRQQCGSEG